MIDLLRLMLIKRRGEDQIDQNSPSP